MLGGRGLVGLEVGARLAFAMAFAASVAGCSGKSENSDDEDGGGGTSGRPSKLGLNLFVRNPSAPEVAGMQCPASSGIEWDIGAPILMNGTIVDVDSPSPTDFGSTLEDGQDGTDIDCTVTASGMLNVGGGGVDPQIIPPDGMVDFTLTGTANARGGGNVIGFSVFTPITQTLATLVGFPACTMPAVHQVAPGALWADIDCPALLDPMRRDVACAATGTLVIEYCSTE